MGIVAAKKFTWTMVVVAGILLELCSSCEESSVGPVERQDGATPLVWRWENPVPQSNTLAGIAFPSQDQVVFTGTMGAIVTHKVDTSEWNVSSLGRTGFPNIFVVDGTRWIVAGYECDGFTYLDCTGRIFLSTSEGKHWQQAWSQGTSTVDDVWFVNDRVGVAVGATHILRTADGGSSWTKMRDVPSWLFAVQFVTEDRGIAIGSDGGLFHTFDGGVTWVDSMRNDDERLMSISFADADTVLVVGYDNASHRALLLRSTDGGTSWVTYYRESRITYYAVCFVTSKVAVVVGEDGIFLRSNDAGLSWKPQSIGADGDLLGVGFLDERYGVIAGREGTILESRDGGDTWKSLVSGTRATLNGLAFSDPSRGIVVGNEGTVIRTHNGGKTWTESSSGSSVDLYGVSFAEEQVATAVGAHGTILRTTDGGLTWVAQNGETESQLRDIFMSNADSAVAVGFDSTVVWTADGGATWDLADLALDPERVWSAPRLMDVEMVNERVGVTVGDVFLRTEDGGRSWCQVGDGIYGWAVDFLNEDEGVVVGSGQINLTSDGGKNWRKIAFENRPINEFRDVSYVDSRTLVAVAQWGVVHISTDGGESWSMEWTASDAPINAGDFFTRRTGVIVGELGSILRAVVQ